MSWCKGWEGEGGEVGALERGTGRHWQKVPLSPLLSACTTGVLVSRHTLFRVHFADATLPSQPTQWSLLSFVAKTHWLPIWIFEEEEED